MHVQVFTSHQTIVHVIKLEHAVWYEMKSDHGTVISIHQSTLISSGGIPHSCYDSYNSGTICWRIIFLTRHGSIRRFAAHSHHFTLTSFFLYPNISFIITLFHWRRVGYIESRSLCITYLTSNSLSAQLSVFCLIFNTLLVEQGRYIYRSTVVMFLFPPVLTLC